MNKDTKQKIAALKYPGTPKVILDTIRLLHEEIMGLESHDEIEIAALAKDIVQTLRERYKRQIVSSEVAAHQVDLEVLIAGIKSGEVPEWKNKHITNEIQNKEENG